jgi:hypothetical protein
MSAEFWATLDADSMLPQHMPADVAYLLPATSFYRKGFKTPRLPEGAEVAVDCGGFVATKVWGEYRFDLHEYVAWCERVPGLRWAAMMDQCCEQEITGANDGVVRQRQVWTYAMAERFVEEYGDVPWAWVPTLQGWTVEDYLRAADDLEPLIRTLQSFYAERPGGLYCHTDEPDPELVERYERNMLDFRVGIGTLCARKDISQVVDIVEALVERFPGVSFHLWGVKLQALRDWPGGLPGAVVSVDSAAWNGRFGSDITSLNDERARRSMTQREFGYRVQLPRYVAKFREAVGYQRPVGVPAPRIERQLKLAI